jgi:glutamyl-tRNA synthetase
MSQPPRVRFAPSPTGYLHVGGLRTALYNYLFARKHGGVFVLRIEDTDQTRLVPGAVEKLIDSLRWTGLSYDEGPDIGGPRRPYRQSERLARYREAADRLVSMGHAYPCFCTPERLAEMRQEQQRKKQDPRYDRACLRLDAEEIRRKLDSGAPHTIRLRIPDEGEVIVSDRVRGEVRFSPETIDDQVLLKSDGFPTYHLANVVDDHDMGITHVIRGEEWLTSTPKHVLLYRFLGYEPPEFAHLPLLLNPDRSKLSKRQGDVAVEDYREQRYLPEALINFVAFLGWNPGDDREIFSLEELVREFSLERVNKSGAVFNIEKLRWFNQEYLRRRPVEKILEELRPLLDERGWRDRDDAYLRGVIELMRERVTFVHEIPERGRYFFADPEEYEEAAVKKRWKPESRELLERFLPRMESLAAFDAAELQQTVQAFAEAEAVKAGSVIHPLRLACSGVGGGPSLYEMLAVLGKDACLRRIRRALEVLA